MNFVQPEYQKIYDTLVNNKKTIQHLTDIGSLYTAKDYYDRYGFTTDKNAISLYINRNNKIILEKLASLFYENISEIESKSIEELSVERFLETEIKYALGFDTRETLTIKTLKEIYYNFKTSFVENFFQNNWESFIPECDIEALKDADFNEALMDSILKEFDRLDNIITETKKFKSYKEIPIDYLNYLSQLLGFERKTFVLNDDKNEEFRVLAENILDVYSNKGTFASFELLFNFLGFKISLIQYYFDRRMYFADENLETGETDKNSYKFYLTKYNPTDNNNENFFVDEFVTDDKLSYKYRLENFNNLVDKYSLDSVLGYSDIYLEKKSDGSYGKTKYYDNDVYKYFKTNLVKIVPGLFKEHENLSVEQQYTINAILDFLTPEFWQRELITELDSSGDKERIILYGRLYAQKDEDYKFRILDSESYIIKNEDEETKTSKAEKELSGTLKKKYLFNVDDYTVIDDYYCTIESESKKNLPRLYENSVGETKENSKRLNNGLEIFFKPVNSHLRYIDTNGYNFLKNENNKEATDENIKKIYINPFDEDPVAIFIPGTTEEGKARWKDDEKYYSDIFYNNDKSYRNKIIKNINEISEELETVESSSNADFQKINLLQWTKVDEVANLNDLCYKYKILNYDYYNDKLLEVSKIPELVLDTTKNFAYYKYNNPTDSEEIALDLIKNNYIKNSYFITKNSNAYQLYKLVDSTIAETKTKAFKKVSSNLDRTITIQKYILDDIKEEKTVSTTEPSTKYSFPAFVKDENNNYYYLNENNYFVSIDSKFVVYVKEESTAFSLFEANTGYINNSEKINNKISESELIDGEIGNIYFVKSSGKSATGDFRFPQLYYFGPIKTNNYFLYDNKLFKKNYNVVVTENNIFGAVEVLLKDNIQKSENKYYSYPADELYEGVIIDDDNDNFILNNKKRIINWDIFKDCNNRNNEKNYNWITASNDNNLFENSVIARPIRHITDAMFDDNNINLSKNILKEMLGDENELLVLRGNK